MKLRCYSINVNAIRNKLNTDNIRNLNAYCLFDLNSLKKDEDSANE